MSRRRKKLRKFLESRHYVIFPGESWDLTDPRERAKAAEWLESLIREIRG